VTNPEQRPDQPARAPLPDAWWELSLLQRRLVVGVLLFAVLVGLIGGVRSLFFGEEREPNPIVFVAALSPQRVDTWDRLAECESTSRWDLSTGNGFEGGLQFTQSSWEEVGGEGSPAAASREEQIMRGEFLYDLQGWNAWPSCSAQLGLNDS